MGVIGIERDFVTLTLAGDELLIAESYEIQFGLLTQPGSFALRLGSGERVAQLIKKYPAHTPFELAIDGAVCMAGYTDGYTVSDNGGASEFTIRGRDALAQLHDGYLRSEQSFTDITFADLTKACLDETVGKNNYTLIYSNNENRKAVTRVPDRSNQPDIKSLAASTATVGASTLLGLTNQGIAVALSGAPFNDPDSTSEPSPNSQRTIQAKLGQKVYANLLKPELDRAGIFIWQSSLFNTFILSTADTTQKPLYRITRKRGSTHNQVNVKRAQFRNETAGRFSSCEVHFRRGGGAEGRARGYGLFVDEEITKMGITRPLVLKHDKCKSIVEADFYAKRRICETIRNHWALEYTVAGHTTPWVQGPGYVVWFFDTTVEVDDDEYDIHGVYYIENVQMQSHPEKTTTIRLMPLNAAAFGDLES